MALIKRETLTSRKVLYTKSCTQNQFFFCKKMLSKIWIFWLKMSAKAKKKKKWHILFVKIFQVSSDEGMGK